jgi:hypothetical protein
MGGGGMEIVGDVESKLCLDTSAITSGKVDFLLIHFPPCPFGGVGQNK